MRFGESLQIEDMIKEEHKVPSIEASVEQLLGKVVTEQTAGSDPKLSTTGYFQRCESIGKQPNAGE